MSTSHADTHPTVRLAGVCGVVSAVLLLAVPMLPGPDNIAPGLWVLGWVLLLPFFGGVATLARTADGRAAWLSPAIPAAAAVLVSVHLINVGIEHVANTMSKTSPVHEPLHEIGGALFMLAILPLGVALTASAAVGLVGRVLPRWLAWTGLAVGLMALANGTMIGSESAWGFLLGIVWVLAGGITLALRRTSTMVAPEIATATT